VSAPLIVQGFAARTNVTTELYPGVFERIEPGAFRRSITNPDTDVVFNLEHGQGGSRLPLARLKAGSLRLSEVETGQETGLCMIATLHDDDPDAHLLAMKLASGAMDGAASFAFRIPKNGMTVAHYDDHSLRTISQVNMSAGDVTACVFGAYPQAHLDLASPSAGRAAASPRREIPDYTTAARREYQILLSRLKG
jgi:HK97 family phage prohead protease